MASEARGKTEASPRGGVAVQLRRAYKHYGSGNSRVKILDGLDMTVTKGTIYGLLGASGCGKTTLLNCVIGLRKLDAGEVTVLGGIPGEEGTGVPGHRLGYMPQELSLLQEFTILNALTYFGWLFGISGRELKERTDFLLDLLQLTSKKNAMIKNLSGGQQRRVSFAGALLHDAELLILDEPTVGLDPELRQSIWDYLKQITESGQKTVIITTHYIEEAKQAHTIGIMRKGRLLAQDTPENLLSLHRTETLEEVFLDLSRLQENESKSPEFDKYPNGIEGDYYYRTLGGTPLKNTEKMTQTLEFGEAQKTKEPDYYYRALGGTPLKNTEKMTQTLDFGEAHKTKEKVAEKSKRHTESCASVRRRRSRTIGKWKAMLMKNAIQISRNLGSLFFVFGFPFTTLSLFFLAVGFDPELLPLAIVNQEVEYDNTSSYQCADYNTAGCNDTTLSCRYLLSLQRSNSIKEEYFMDQKSAMESVRKGNAWGVVVIPKNFTIALEMRRENGKDIEEDILSSGEISVYLDMTNNIIGTLLKRKLLSEFQDFLRNVLADCEYNPKFGETPIMFNDPVFGKKDPTYRDFIAPGVLNSIIYFVVVGMTAITMVKEREEGLWDRMMAAAISPWEVLVSHITTTTVLIAMQTIEIIILALYILGVECKGSVLLFAAHIFLNGFIGMAFGLIVSLVSRNVAEANYLGTGSFYPYLLLCGILWPLEGLPWYMYHLSSVLPLTMSTESLRNIMEKGWGITSPSVYIGYLATIGWTILYFACSYAILRFKKS